MVYAEKGITQTLNSSYAKNANRIIVFLVRMELKNAGYVKMGIF